MPAVTRAIPWARVFAVAKIVAARVGDDIPEKDRKYLVTVLKTSKGDPRKLTASERRELLKILRQVDYKKLGREVAAAAAAAKLLKR